MTKAFTEKSRVEVANLGNDERRSLMVTSGMRRLNVSWARKILDAEYNPDHGWRGP